MPSINGRFGQISKNPSPDLWAPLISLTIAKYEIPTRTPEGRLQHPSNILRENVIALIDTGAQAVVVDQSTAQELSLQEGHGSSVIFIGKEVTTKSYLTTLWNTEISFLYAGDLPGGEFSSLPFKIILGWDFLRRFDLTLLRKSNVVRLDWVG
jgi:hypothetical protein